VLQPTPKTVTIPAGQVTTIISVHVYSYPAPEPYPETFFIQLLNPSGAILGRSLGAGTIIQDTESDLAQRLYVGDTGVVRSSSGNQFAEFTVTLAAPQTTAVTFQFATSDGTAIQGTDYTTATGIGTINAGATSVYIQVPILPGTSPSPPLTYTVTLSNVTGGAILTRATGSGVIF
jgi:Calx-beta domain